MAHWSRVVAVVTLALLAVPARGQVADLPAEVSTEVKSAPAAPPAPPAAGPTVAEPAKEEAAPLKLEDLAWRKGPVSLVPFGVGIVNVNYNTRRLFQGSYALYAYPGDFFDRSQFEISPQNTFLGVDITGPRIGDAQLSGRIDFDLRGPNPVQNNASPYFFEIFGELKTDRWRVLLGQAHDVVSPLDPSVLNFTMGKVGYMPGDIGFFRAQARLELYWPISDTVQLTWQGALAQQVVEPLQSAPDLFGSDAGWPDIQGRVALGLGRLEGTTRPAEFGVSAHIGERVLEIMAPPLLRHYRTWSLNADLRATLTEQTRVQGEVFAGQVLGSYNGGIFQGIDPGNLKPIRAAGGWLELEQQLSPCLRGHIGAGIDDAADHGLTVGRRSRNVAYWGNLYWNITERLTWAGEVSWWDTGYVGLPAGQAARIETTVLFQF